MAGRERGAQGQREASEKMREQARRLLEQASPEERRELERLAREMQDRARQAGGDDAPRDPGAPAPAGERPWQTEAFDARGETPDGPRGPQHVIADWLGDEAERPAGAAPAASPGAPLREAAEGVERAIDRQAVPRTRSDLVRRVFERYRQRAAEPGSPGAEPGRGG
jgi:hypothetical protein